jgi:hypothetical protein
MRKLPSLDSLLAFEVDAKDPDSRSFMQWLRSEFAARGCRA